MTQGGEGCKVCVGGEELQCHTVSDDTGTPKQVSVGRAFLGVGVGGGSFFFVLSSGSRLVCSDELRCVCVRVEFLMFYSLHPLVNC